MVDIICMGLPDLFGTRTENYKMKNSSFPHSGIRTRDLPAYEANALSVELSELIYTDHLKASAFYPQCYLKLPVPRVHLVLPVLFLEILSCIFLI